MTLKKQESTPLQEWANAHEPGKDLSYRDEYWSQIIFVRDKVAGLLAKTYEEFERIQANIKVISTHTSKSVCLPVFYVELEDGTKFTMRDNFYNWKVSISSPRGVIIEYMGIFDPNAISLDTFCEGFPKEMVYGAYADNKRQFTIDLPSGNYHLFTFFWIFAHQVLGNRNKGGIGR